MMTAVTFEEVADREPCLTRTDDHHVKHFCCDRTSLSLSPKNPQDIFRIGSSPIIRTTIREQDSLIGTDRECRGHRDCPFRVAVAGTHVLAEACERLPRQGGQLEG